MINKIKTTTALILCMTLFLLVGCSRQNVTLNQKSNNKNNISIKNDINQKSKPKNDFSTTNESKNNEKVDTHIKHELKEINKTIVIDPGHASTSNLDTEPIAPNSDIMKIKDGGGATGISTNIPEYSTCMSIALLVKNNLLKQGFNVVMTKDKNEVSLGNVDRAEVGNKLNANLVVRIHADSNDSPDAEGASLLVPSPTNENTAGIYDASSNYGNIIINNYCSKLNLYNRGVVIRDDMTGFNWSKVPVVILEMGFLSNPKEDEFLSNISNHELIANTIAESIALCFSN